MIYKVLSATGMRVSRLALGTGAWGVAPLAEDCGRLVQRALDLGVNVFDTGNNYGNMPRVDRPGAPPAAERESSEAILGRALEGRRQEAIICTKAREVIGPGINDYGLSRRHLTQQIERSLRMLRTDYVDIYYAHGPDPETPLIETLRTFDDLVKQGKIRYFALSNYSSWQLTHAIDLCDRYGLNRPVAHQVGYNLVSRGIEAEVVPACRHFGVDIVAYFPLNAGLLAGAEARARPVVGLTRFVVDKSKPVPIPQEQLRGAEELDRLAAKWGHPPARIAVSWLLHKPYVAAAIVGPETPEELEQSIEAVKVKLDAEQMEALDRLCPPAPGHDARYNTSQPPRTDPTPG